VSPPAIALTSGQRAPSSPLYAVSSAQFNRPTTLSIDNDVTSVRDLRALLTGFDEPRRNRPPAARVNDSAGVICSALAGISYLPAAGEHLP